METIINRIKGYTMTVKEKLDLQPTVRIPIWVITFITPLIISLIGAVVYQAKTQAKILNTLQNQDDKIKELRIELADKVSRAELNDFKTYFLRLEDKVDRLIERLK